MEDKRHVIGLRMRHMREQHQWSQEDVAQRIRRLTGRKVPRNSFSYYENAERYPDTWVLIAAAQALETSLAYLVGETDDPSPTVRPALTPAPELWGITKKLNRLTPALRGEAAQFIEATLNFAGEYGAYVSSGIVAKSDPQPADTDLDAWAGQSISQLQLDRLEAEHLQELLTDDDAADLPNGDNGQPGAARQP